MTSEEFKQIRQDLGLSVSEAAELLNLNRSNYLKMESGERPVSPVAAQVYIWLDEGNILLDQVLA